MSLMNNTQTLLKLETKLLKFSEWADVNNYEEVIQDMIEYKNHPSIMDRFSSDFLEFQVLKIDISMKWNGYQKIGWYRHPPSNTYQNFNRHYCQISDDCV